MPSSVDKTVPGTPHTPHHPEKLLGMLERLGRTMLSFLDSFLPPLSGNVFFFRVLLVPLRVLMLAMAAVVLETSSRPEVLNDGPPFLFPKTKSDFSLSPLSMNSPRAIHLIMKFILKCE